MIPSSGGFSRRFAIFVRGRTATDTCSQLLPFALHLSHRSHFPGTTRACVLVRSSGIGSGSGPVVRSVP